MQQKSERVTMVKKSDCHSKIVTVDRYACAKCQRASDIHMYYYDTHIYIENLD